MTQEEIKPRHGWPSDTFLRFRGLDEGGCPREDRDYKNSKGAMGCCKSNDGPHKIRFMKVKTI